MRVLDAMRLPRPQKGATSLNGRHRKAARKGGVPRNAALLRQPHHADGHGLRMSSRPNPRRSNGSRRTRLRNWLKAQGRPCWICRAFGRPGTIDYDLPAGHPWSFEVDELVPVSKGGGPYDHANVDAAHRCCNQWRGNKSVERVMQIARATRPKRVLGKCSGKWGACE